MRKLLLLLATGTFLAAGFWGCQRDSALVGLDQGGPTLAGKATGQQGTKIQDGVLTTSDGQVIETGYDQWGYNYQAHMFNGYYCDAYRDASWCQQWKSVRLMMKWNDAWLSNVDRDGDGLLDRHYGFPSYIGSGAWLTNHQSGEENGEKWSSFVKIVAAPADAYQAGGNWYAADGGLIGEVIWGEFAIIQQVEGGLGATFVSPEGPGFGKFKP